MKVILEENKTMSSKNLELEQQDAENSYVLTPNGAHGILCR